MSRQSAVHVLAGVLVVASVALSFWVSHWWLLLTAFVGLNLFQSGFTGFCPAETIFGKLGFRDVSRDSKHATAMPEMLAQYRRLHPRVHLDLEVSNTQVIQQYLLDHRVDVAVTEGFVHSPGLVARVFLNDELVPIVAPNNPMAKSKSVTVKAFCTHPLLIREVGSGTREVIEEALLRRRIKIKPLMTLGSTEAIKRSVAAGVGVALVSALAIKHELASRRLIQISLKDFRLKRVFHLVQARDRSPSTAVKAFISLLPEPPRTTPSSQIS